MTTQKKSVQWAFAIFVAFGSYCAMTVLFALLIVTLAGLPIGAKTPPDFQPQVDAKILGLLAHCAVWVPVIAAAFFGGITAPESERRIASVMFPVLTFLAINLVFNSGGSGHGFGISYAVQTGASCAMAGAFLYLRKSQHQSKPAGT